VQPPPTWGQDDLSEFIDGAHANAFATFANLSGSYSRIRDIDSLFTELFTDFKDPDNLIGAGLGLRCHSALRAAAQLAISGQVPEAFMVLRGALELALYAHHASTSDARADIWLNRQDNEATRKQCSKEFTPRVMFPILRAVDKGLGDIVGKLYERTIDYGAHPNAAGVLTTMEHKENDGDQEFSFAYFTADQVSLRFIIQTWGQVALSCLDMLSYVLPTRFLEKKTIRKTIPMRAGL
jgi:hypothetical protein